MTDALAQFGRTIRRLRESKKLSLSALARLAGISKAYLSQLENDERKKPSVDVALNLANALDIPLSRLLGIKETPRVNAADLPPGRRIFWQEYPDLPESVIFALSYVPTAERTLTPTDYWLLYETMTMVTQRP